jgi:hypothetical protein
MKQTAMHNIQLSDPAFLAFQRRAESVGLSVAEYLNQIGAAVSEPDQFILTPEIRAGIEMGLAQAERGELISQDALTANLEREKAEWRASKTG